MVSLEQLLVLYFGYLLLMYFNGGDIMKLTEEQINIINALKKIVQKVILIIKNIWLKLKINLLKTPEGRKILMKIISNNNWRRMHKLPMIRRCG